MRQLLTFQTLVRGSHAPLYSIFVAVLCLSFLGSSGSLPLSAGHSFRLSLPRVLVTQLAPASVVAPTSQNQMTPELYAAYAQAVQKNAAPEYNLSPSPGGYQSQNVAHQLAASFGPRGLNFGSAGWQLHFDGFAGADGSLAEPSSAAWPIASANRVEYQRAGLTEWYVNGELGLEQGFTVEQVPASAADGWLRLELHLSGATAQLSESSSQSASGAKQQLVIQSNNGQRWEYSKLQAWDATRQILGSRMQLSPDGKTIQLVVDARQATYPLTVDPFFSKAQELVPDDSQQPNDYFGGTVALSADDTVALVSAFGKNVGANTAQGAVYVFTRTSSTATFSQSQLLTATDGTSWDMLNLLALSADGSTALLAACDKVHTGDGYKGQVYVFTRLNDGLFTQTQIMTSNFTTGTYGSLSLKGTLSPDGNVAVVGSPNKNNQQGAAFVFLRDNLSSAYYQSQEVTITNGAAFDQFGNSLALSANTNTLIVSAYGYGPKPPNSNNRGPGAAYVFTRSQAVTTFIQAQIITASDGVSNDGLGYSVALAGDSNTLLLSAPGKNSAQGAFYVFNRNLATGIYTQTQLLIPKDTLLSEWQNTTFLSVSLSNDGNTIIIPVAYFNSPTPPGFYQTGIFIYTRTDGDNNFTYSQFMDVSHERPGVYFRFSAVLAGDGNSILVGDENSTITGTAYVLNRTAPVYVDLSATPKTSSYGQPVTFTAVVSGDGGVVPTGAVTFYLDSQPTYTATLPPGAATVSYTSSSLAIGKHGIYARYNGGNFPLADSANVTVTVNKLASTVSVTSNPNSALPGANIVFTASVTPPTAPGLVTFTIGSAIVSATLANGLATYATTTLPIGNYPVTVQYGGSAVYNASLTTGYIQQVVPPCNPVVVTSVTDDGAASTCGTLSYALLQATGSGTTITFALTAGNTISFTGSLTPTVAAGVTLDGGASGVVLEGNGQSGDGLRLAGNNHLLNLKVQHFGGREIVAKAGGNWLYHVQTAY